MGGGFTMNNTQQRCQMGTLWKWPSFPWILLIPNDTGHSGSNKLNDNSVTEHSNDTRTATPFWNRMFQSLVLTTGARDLCNRGKSRVGGSQAPSTEYQTAWKISIPIDRSIPTDSSHCSNLETQFGMPRPLLKRTHHSLSYDFVFQINLTQLSLMTQGFIVHLSYFLEKNRSRK